MSEFLTNNCGGRRLSEHGYVYVKDGKTGPGPRAETGRAGLGPENPGPRALRAETGLMIFYLRFLCALCAGRSVVTRELCIVVTCKCVVY